MSKARILWNGDTEGTRVWFIYTNLLLSITSLIPLAADYVYSYFDLFNEFLRPVRCWWYGYYSISTDASNLAFPVTASGKFHGKGTIMEAKSRTRTIGCILGIRSEH